MGSLALVILSIAACLWRFCRAASATFLIPPNVGVENLWRDNPEYQIGEAINITWTSKEEVLDLILEIQFPNEPDAPGESWKWVTLQS